MESKQVHLLPQVQYFSIFMLIKHIAFLKSNQFPLSTSEVTLSNISHLKRKLGIQMSVPHCFESFAVRVSVVTAQQGEKKSLLILFGLKLVH